MCFSSREICIFHSGTIYKASAQEVKLKAPEANQVVRHRQRFRLSEFKSSCVPFCSSSSSRARFSFSPTSMTALLMSLLNSVALLQLEDSEQKKLLQNEPCSLAPFFFFFGRIGLFIP